MIKRSLSLSLVLSLLAAVPGLPAWSAAAQVVSGGAASGARVSPVAPAALPALPAFAPAAAAGAGLGLSAETGLPPSPQGGAAATPSAASPAGAAASAAAAPVLAPSAPRAASGDGLSLPVQPSGSAPASLPSLLGDAESLSLSRDQAQALPPSGAREAGDGIMDRVLGLAPVRRAGEAVFAAPGSGAEAPGLSPAAPRPSGDGAVQPPAPPSGGAGGPRGRSWGSKLWGAAKSLLRVGAAGAAVVGLQAGAVALLPSVFGLVPVAAVWAVSSGILLLPIGLYARYRLSLRDSPRLSKVKWTLDAALGAFLGALAIAVPSLGVVLAANGAAGLGLAAAAGGGTLLALSSGGRIADVLFAGLALAAVPLAFMGAVGAGAIGLGPILGMMALPAMTTVAFFLGRVIQSAETGEPFSVPGTMRKLRFPAFNWVMMGVVFALTTGYGAVYSNIAFMAWMFLGSRPAPGWTKGAPVWRNLLGLLLNFDTLFLGLLAFTAATGFSSPLTFLVLVFAPERAAVWTERLLSRFLPASEPSPSTRPLPQSSLKKDDFKPVRGLHWVKTGLLLATMASIGVAMGFFVFGFSGLLPTLGIAAALSFIPFFLSNWLIKKLMRAQPADPARDPEFFSIMSELRGKINAKRAAKGRKPIPMPELVNVPMPIPNAFATGRSPFKATVGVTEGFKDLVLYPETARGYLVRVIAAAGREPEGKPFRVFRKAIAGSIPGVTLESSPEEITQALIRADAADIKALGTRVLRGVLAHEFSHVMDRHMLTGAIGGTIASAIAFASYGVMWTVGHARAAVSRLKDRLLSRKEKGGPSERATGLSPDGPPRGAKPEALEPISTGLVLKSLPALLKMFAALWGPIIVQIVQLAGSRNNESQADFDGAALSEDAESLALGLGLLMAWRPPAGFLFEMARLPRVAAAAHLFTVNPIQQLHEAQAMPKPGPEADWAWGRGDNFLLDLFLTHPDTTLRIERLHDLSEGAGRRTDRRPPPATPPPGGGGGGGLSPPLALRASGAADAPTPGRGGPFRRAWERVAASSRVLPDKDRNREFWKFSLGQALITLGAFFQYTALPALAAPTKGDSARLGYNRAGNWGSQAAASLTTGPLVDRSPTRSVLVWTLVGRALVLMTVPILFFHGLLGFWTFLAVTVAAGFLQSTGLTASAVAFNRIIEGHERHYNRANAVFNLLINLTGVLGPIAAGTFIGLLDARFGLLAGNALSYGVYALAAGLVALAYWRTLRLPTDPLLEARRSLARRLARGPGRDRRVKGVLAVREDGVPTLLVEASGEPSEVAVPAEFEGFPVRVIAKRRPLRELLEGARLVLKNRFLRLYLLFGTVALTIADSLMFALPRYIQDVLGPSQAMPGWLASIPLLGPLLGALTGKAGAFGLYLAAASLGLGISAFLMMRAGRKEGEAEEPARDPLVRQGWWTSWLHGLGWLAYWGIFFSTGLWGSVGAMLLAMVLRGPAIIVWSSLIQRTVNRELPESMGKVIAFMSFYQLALSIGGVLVLGWLMTALSTSAALTVVGVLVSVAALLDFIAPAVIFRSRPGPDQGPNR